MKQQLTLGEFIKKLNDIDPDRSIQFDFVYMAPTTLDSYRGDYKDLALGYAVGKEVTVKALLQEANRAMDSVFEGYKGGDFRMGYKTPLWVANWGEGGRTEIVDVVDVGWTIIIETKHEDITQ